MKKGMTWILVAAAVGLMAGAAFAQFAKTEEAVKYRQSVMSVIGTHFSRMGAVVKGEAPYAKEAFEQNASIVAMLIPLPWDAFMAAGSDKFVAITGVDGTHAIAYAERMGLGTRGYELVTVE